MTKERKAEIMQQFATHEGDTGSPEVQIALLTERINHLNEHLKLIILVVVYCRWLAVAAVCSITSRKRILRDTES